MRVKDCMCNHLVKAAPETSITDAAKLMNSHKIGCLPVCTPENDVVGMVTDRDIITRAVACDKNCKETKLSDIMTINVIKTTPDTDVEYATRIMSNNQIRRLPVVEENKIVGVLSLGDIAQNDEIPCEDVGITLEGICEND